MTTNLFTMKSFLILLAVASLAQIADAQQNGAFPSNGIGRQTPNPDTEEIRVLPVRDHVFMLVGNGGNITVQVGNQGILVVNTGSAAMSDKLLALIQKLSDRKIRYIINTDGDPDDAGGNQTIRAAGIQLVGREEPGAANHAGILAHENVLTRMSAPSGQQSPTPVGAWPTDTFTGRQKGIYFNREPIQILHQPAAHTDGDSIVFFRRSDVISAGNIFLTTTYPVIDLQHGGTIQGLIDGLNNILDLTIPEHSEEGGTLVIPGRGRLSDRFDVAEYRDMVTIMRDRIQAMIKKGLTLEQVKAARPTRDYDPRYGTNTGPWTTDMFVDAVYKSLHSAK